MLVRIPLRLPQRLKSRVERAAKQSGESSQAFMVRAIKEQVRVEELHQQFLADAVRADEAMQESGTGYAARAVQPTSKRRRQAGGRINPGQSGGGKKP